jgi:hypothetical protein
VYTSGNKNCPLFVVVVVIFSHWYSGEYVNSEHLHNSAQHFCLESKHNRKHVYYLIRASFTESGMVNLLNHWVWGAGWFSSSWLIHPIISYLNLEISYFRTSIFIQSVCHAVAKAVSLWLPTAAARVRVRAGMWVLWWTKRHWDWFSPSTSISLANHHSTNFSIIIITRGWHNRPISSGSAEWTQSASTPHYTNLKFIQPISGAFLFLWHSV